MSSCPIRGIINFFKSLPQIALKTNLFCQVFQQNCYLKLFSDNYKDIKTHKQIKQ
jgi:hypothetical protein